MEENEQQVRLATVQALSAQQIPSWPLSFPPVTLRAGEVKKAYESKGEDNEYVIGGRVIGKRDHGKSIFLTIEDYTGTVQAYIKKEAENESVFSFILTYLYTGDHAVFSGVLFLTKTGQITLRIAQVQITAKCLPPLTVYEKEATDRELCYRKRYLDLLVHKKTRERFLQRSALIAAIRSFLHEHECVEVETPMLHPIPGGAMARPFVTHHNALSIDLYLRIAPELYLKRLVVGGMERVYEINRNFRNEGVSVRHNPEFTMLECYVAYKEYQWGMSFVESLLRTALMKVRNTLSISFHGNDIDFSKPFARLTPKEVLVQWAQYTPESLEESVIDQTLQRAEVVFSSEDSYQKKLYLLFEKEGERYLQQPTFVIDFPIEVSPLSQKKEGEVGVAARFELFIGGMEIANGFNELNDPFDQAERFKAQAHDREAGNNEAMYYDEEYIAALEYGLPPTFGFGVGIDRFAMIVTDVGSIKDIILFPTTKRKEK